MCRNDRRQPGSVPLVRSRFWLIHEEAVFVNGRGWQAAARDLREDGTFRPLGGVRDSYSSIRPLFVGQGVGAECPGTQSTDRPAISWGP
jgi:hypothetical protein